MILLVNGWQPDIVAEMSEKLNAQVHRIGDCTWLKTEKDDDSYMPNMRARDNHRNVTRSRPLNHV